MLFGGADSSDLEDGRVVVPQPGGDQRRFGVRLADAVGGRP
jgi:hypothetical protein